MAAEDKDKFKSSTAFKTLPNIKSSDKDWIKWTDHVESKYGTELGTQVFLAAWNKFGSSDANTIAFRHHIKSKYDLEIDESVWNKVADLGGGISRGIGKMFKVGKITLIVAGGIIAVVAVSVIVNVIKTGRLPVGPAALKGGK